jgi:hypothetical protein
MYPRIPALETPLRSFRERCRFRLRSLFILMTVCGVGLMVARFAHEDPFAAGMLAGILIHVLGLLLPPVWAATVCCLAYRAFRRVD